jgi:hypothetical protein
MTMTTATESTMATPTRKDRKPRTKPARFIRLIIPPTLTMAGIVKIIVGKSATDYNLERLPSDFGTAFRLTKILGDHESYAVNIDGDKRTCECKGYLKHGHCKHGDGLAKLQEKGRI